VRDGFGAGGAVDDERDGGGREAETLSEFLQADGR
jgi:hypothetical protein